MNEEALTQRGGGGAVLLRPKKEKKMFINRVESTEGLKMQ